MPSQDIPDLEADPPAPRLGGLQQLWCALGVCAALSLLPLRPSLAHCFACRHTVLHTFEKPEIAPHGCRSWLYPVLLLSDVDLLRTAGLDALVGAL